MTDSTSTGGTVDVAHFSFTKACHRGGNVLGWGVYKESAYTYGLRVGYQLFTVNFWSNYVQIGIYRNNSNADQQVLVRGNSYSYSDVVSDKYYISAVTFGEDEVFNPPFVNMIEVTGDLSKDYVDEYLDYCQIRRMYELTSPVLTTATVTEIRIPYSYLSWFVMDSERRVYNDDGSLKDDYFSDNNMFSDYEN